VARIWERELASQVVSGELEVGRVVQAVGAFTAVFSAFTVILENFESLSRFVAGVDRLSTFRRALDTQAAQAAKDGQIESVEGSSLSLEDVTVRILDLKSPQTVVIVLERQKEHDVARRELFCQGIGVRNVDVSVPTCDALFDVSRVIWDRLDADVLHHDHRAPALDDSEKYVVRCGTLKCNFEAELIAIEGESSRDICDDEEWSCVAYFLFSHLSFQF